jgi:hypothetical protein
MAETYHIKALQKKRKKLRMRLHLLIPEIDDFCYAKNCVLQILWDKAHPAFGLNCPLNQAMSQSQRQDPRWLMAHQSSFVEAVSLLDTANYPAESDAVFAEQDTRKLPQATIEVFVTDEKWIEHIRAGDEWDSVPVDADPLM